MKYIISLLFFTLSLFGFDYHLKSYKVADGVECFFGLSSTANEINGGNIINSCYIKSSEGYVVIDSGPTYSYAQQANQIMREKEPLPIKYVINTTAEEVHILGNSFYKEQGATLLGPKEYKKYEHKKRFKIERFLTQDTFENTTVVPLDRYIESSESIYVGELKIDIIKIIEKSNRYLVVYIPKLGTLFAGDMVFNNRLPSLKSGRSINQWLKAINKIEKISWQHLISSHGIKTKYTAIKNTKSYLTVLKDSVSKKIRAKEDRETILNTTTMFSFMEDPLYDECHQENVSIAYRELKKELSKEKRVSMDTVPSLPPKPKHFHNKKVLKKQILKKRSVEPNIRYYSFDKAIKKAISNRKLVLVKVYSDNCPFCRELDAILLKNNQVKRLINRNFVMVKVNNSQARIPLGVEVGVTPSLIFVRADTKEVKMVIPGIEALGELISILKEGIADGHEGGYLN